MSVLSSMALLTVSSPVLAQPKGIEIFARSLPADGEQSPLHADTTLLELGRQLKQKLTAQEAASKAVDILHGSFDWDAYDKCTQYRRRSDVDRRLFKRLVDCLRSGQSSVHWSTDWRKVSLLGLTGDRFVDKRAAELVAWDQALKQHFECDDARAVEDAYDLAFGEVTNICKLIEQERAHSVEGLIVKMHAVRVCRGGTLHKGETDCTDEQLLQSILVDIEGMECVTP